MSTETTLAPRKPRLNPFVFPSDTDFRFVLLIATVLGVSISYFMILIDNKLPFVQQRWVNGVTSCGIQVYGQGFDQFLNQINNFEAAPINDAEKILFDKFYACTLPFDIEKTLWVLVGVALLIGVAALLFWIFPVRIIFRNQLSPMSDEDAPDVIKFLDRLCHEVELKSHPQFLWNPLNNTSSGLAFGYSGNYYVAISGGLVTQFYTNPSAFRAILLHELAHLKNEDVNKTYFATSIWQAFIVVAVLPVVFFCFGDLSARNFIDLTALIVLVYLIRNSILRVRELYADARADIWDKKDALEQVLAALPHQQDSKWQVMKVHPAPSERRRILTDSNGYFQSNFWIAIATGMAFSIMKGNIENLYNRVGLSLLPKSILSALFFSFLVVGILGLSVWRSAFARSISENVSVGQARLALGTTLGILFHHFLSLTNSSLSLYLFIFEMLWSGILFLVLYALFHWVSSTAEVWLEVAASLRSPRRVYLLNLTLAIAICTVAFTWLWSSHSIFEIEYQQSAFSFLYMIVTPLISANNPIVWMTLSSFWIIPMAAWFWRKQAVSITNAPWAYLEHSPIETQPQALRRVWRPEFAIKTGVTLGFFYCIILLTIRILVRASGLSDVISRNDSYKLIFFYSWVVLALLMQIGMAIIVSIYVKQLSWAHSLFTTFIQAGVMSVGILIVNIIFKIMDGNPVGISAGGGLEPSFIGIVFSQVINFGTFFALIPAIAVSARAGRKSQNHI